jgi:hypothetical protein
VITTAGVLSGVDGALRVVERMLGPADSLGRWDRPTTGVPLTAGVGEIELASAFRPYTELSVDLHDWPRRSGPTPSCRSISTTGPGSPSPPPPWASS